MLYDGLGLDAAGIYWLHNFLLKRRVSRTGYWVVRAVISAGTPTATARAVPNAEVDQLQEPHRAGVTCHKYLNGSIAMSPSCEHYFNSRSSPSCLYVPHRLVAHYCSYCLRTPTLCMVNHLQYEWGPLPGGVGSIFGKRTTKNRPFQLGSTTY